MKKHFILLGLIAIVILFACQSKTANRINSEDSIQSAINMSRSKPIMVDFMAEWCPPCQKMEKTTFSNPKIIAKADSFITVRIDVDEQENVAQKYNGNARKYGGVGIPNILFLSSNGKKLRHIIGYRNGEQLAAVMDSVLTGKYAPTPIN